MHALARINDPRTQTDAAITTKIELVTEAIEALVLATTTNLTTSSQSRDESILRALDLADARKAVADSLRTLLQPTLRVTTPSA